MKVLPITNFTNNQRSVKILLENLELEEKTFGQLYLVEVMPGEKVGNHYHENKEEWIIPLQGKAKIILEHTKTRSRKELIFNTAEDHKRVVIPPNVAHSVVNESDQPLLLIEYSTKKFDPENEDKIFYEMIK